MIALGQNAINLIDEDFSGSEFPDGWTKDGYGYNNWYVSPSFGAGGTPNEMQLSWSPWFNGTARFISPAIDLAGINSAMLSLDVYVVMFGITNKAKIGVATTSDNGATWNDVWSEEYTATEQVSIVENISGPDMGKHNVKFCFYFEGNYSAIQSIYFDNFKVYIVESVGIEATSIDVPNYIAQGKHTIDFTAKNIGETTIKSFEARCIINDEEVFSESFYTEMNYLDSKQFTFEDPYNFIFGEEYDIEIEIFRVNDDELDDTKKMAKSIDIALGKTQKTPMIEHFSSATCGPCVAVNATMAELTHNNEGKYTYTKYVTNWPEAGDPYYTEEVNTKMSYYGISSVPEVYLDGNYSDKSILNEETFQNYYETPALANVRGAFTIDGTTIKVTADFMTYFNAKDIKAYVSVNEKTTTGNAVPTNEGGNGETEFHHVMLKMLSGDNGTAIDINAGEYKRLEFSYDMSQTFMEDINDLEVALWLQDGKSKEIYNSHFAYGYTDHCYPVQNMKAEIILDCTGAIEILWEAPEKGNPTKYNIYIDEELVAENNADNLIYHSEDPQLIEKLNSKTHIAEVVAVYDNNKTSVSVAKVFNGIWENIEENLATNNISVYPNPVNDRLYIETEAEINEVVVYDIYGRVQNLRNSETQKLRNSIDLSELKSGIYFVKINTEKGNIVKRIIKD